ncbi:type II toxin-antitoxin system HicB family antitoxin [Polycladidibacter stylochi]|uniref:type II toxin-antitoxin system HicB family antitoxin n=1 Tax=Polycladidibacter stylochi TaxID=1807766 RepID=UPI000834EB16|nr:type II toxin-antitoxin system HicB family antitoxin [Pseudovibrio stylochi]
MYIATIHKDEDTAYSVGFPDVMGCISYGDNYEEAQANAAEALSLHLNAMLEHGEPLPVPRALDELQVAAKTDEVIAGLLEGAVCVGIPYLADLAKTTRIEIEVDAGLLAAVDSYAQSYNISRAALFSSAVREKISFV